MNSAGWVIEVGIMQMFSHWSVLEGKELQDMLSPLVEQHKEAVAMYPESEVVVAVLHEHVVTVTVRENEKSVQMMLRRAQFHRLYGNAMERFGTEEFVIGDDNGLVIRPRATPESLQ